MFASPKYTEYEMKERRRIEARRKRDEERRRRFFDAKQRTKGIDMNAIEKQKQEKLKMKELEKKRDDYWDSLRIEQARIAEENNKLINEYRKRKLKEINDYRTNSQKKENRREWDLNDPQANKNLPVQRFHDFHGEDIHKSERVKSQQEQMKKWIEEKKEEERRKAEKEKMEQKLFQQQQNDILALSDKIERERNALRTQRNKQTNEFNLGLMQLKKEKEEIKKKEEEMQRLAHIQNQMNSDFLTENYHSTTSNSKKGKYLPYNFKGFGKHEVDEIEKVRQQQIEEKKRLTLQKKKEEEAFDNLTLINARNAILKEREIQRIRSDRLKNLHLFHEKQKELHEVKKKLDDERDTGAIYPDFFNQFNKDCR